MTCSRSQAGVRQSQSFWPEGSAPAIACRSPGRGGWEALLCHYSSVCMGRGLGRPRGPGSPPAGLGAPVPAGCLCWAPWQFSEVFSASHGSHAALCRGESVWGDLRSLWLVPGLPPPRHSGPPGPCVTVIPLTRMIDWVSWPLGKNIDKWIIALLKGLAAVKKFSILIEVSLAKIEKVGGLLS